jgi:transposase, IS5 family
MSLSGNITGQPLPNTTAKCGGGTTNHAPARAVDRVKAILDLPEIQTFATNIESGRSTGRPTKYPIRGVLGLHIAKPFHRLTTWSQGARVLDGKEPLPMALDSYWACSRARRRLRERDRWALDQCMSDLREGLSREIRNMGSVVVVDASPMRAYSSGQLIEREGKHPTPSDPDASWGYRTPTPADPSNEFFGYKMDAVVCAATGAPLACGVRTAKHAEADFALGLLHSARERGFPIKVAIMDMGYDQTDIHEGCMDLGVDPVIPLKQTGPVKRGAAEPPYCEHGWWLFGGAARERKATKRRCPKWRSPVNACTPASVWVKADRYHPFIARDTPRYKTLYDQRTEIEREFSNLKNNWSLTPLRVRGIDQLRLHADLTVLARLASLLVAAREGSLTPERQDRLSSSWFDSKR